MCNITLNKILSQYDKLKIFEKKFLLKRLRLRLTNMEMKYFISILVEHFEHKKYFKEIYKRDFGNFDFLNCNYQNFMKKIKVVSPIFEFLFNRISRLILNKKEESTIKIVDSSLISCLKQNSLRIKHKGDVTVRKDQQNHKIYIAGVKLFTVLNEDGKIIKADVKNINFPDITYLKENVLFFKNSDLLADRGFNSTFLQNNLKTFNLISPHTGRKCKRLTEKEKVLYKKRWKVEVLYKKLKDQYGNYKLNPSFRYNKGIIKAEIFYNLLKFNLN